MQNQRHSNVMREMLLGLGCILLVTCGMILALSVTIPQKPSATPVATEIDTLLEDITPTAMPPYTSQPRVMAVRPVSGVPPQTYTGWLDVQQAVSWKLHDPMPPNSALQSISVRAGTDDTIQTVVATYRTFSGTLWEFWQMPPGPVARQARERFLRRSDTFMLSKGYPAVIDSERRGLRLTWLYQYFIFSVVEPGGTFTRAALIGIAEKLK